MTDQTTISVYDAQTDAYLNMVNQDKPDPWLLEFIGRIDTGGYVLDLGCGPATASSTMREKGLQVDPVDASSEMVHLANEKFAINARQAEFSDLNATDLYDGAWVNFSLLHAHRDDFPGHLAALALAVKPAGILSIGMKTGTGSNRDKLGRFYTYYTVDELTEHLQTAGFKIEKVNTGKEKGLAGSLDPWVTMIAVNTKT